MSRIAMTLALAAGLSVTGCYSTTIRSGAPRGQAPFGWDEKWHGGFIFGIAEMSGPYNLKEVCPGGWAEIRTETGFWNGLVSGLTRDIYSAQTVAVTCATPGTSPAIERAPGRSSPEPSP